MQVLYIFISIIDYSNCTGQPKIAICVAGLASRYQPESIAKNIIGANENDFDFDIFLSLQTKNVHFSGHRGLHTQSTIYTDLDHNQIQEIATKIYTDNSQKFNGFVTVSTRQIRTVREYANELGLNELDRISQGEYWGLRDKVFSMFENQEECAKSIIVKEFVTGKKYNFIIMAREDTYLFKPLNMTSVVSMLGKNCSIITRRCLNWGGLGTRMQVTTRRFGLLLYGSRTTFYKYLADQDMKVYNTEDLEKKHVEWLHGIPLEISIDLFPVSASRYINQTSVCFVGQEVQDNCIPKGYESFVQHNFCS